jgi:hypothetical protein
MMIDHDMRIKSMMRALTEVILPAIDRTQLLAVDQGNILLGTLRIMLRQNDKAYQFLMVELRQYTEVARQLVEMADGGDATQGACAETAAALAEAAPIAALAIPSQAELAVQVEAIKTATDLLLRAANADGAPQFRQAANRLVFDEGGKQLIRERAWVAGAGFELDPASLPPLEVLLEMNAGV